MVSVLFCSTPSEDRVQPLAAIASEFIDHGWRVRFLTGSAFQQTVAASGAEFLPLPRGLTEAANPTRTNASADMAAANDAVREALAHEPADIVLYEPSLVGISELSALPETERPITVICGVTPVDVQSPYLVRQGQRASCSQLGASRMPEATRHDPCAPRGRKADAHQPPAVDLFAQFTVPEFEYPQTCAQLHFFGPIQRVEPPGEPVPNWWSQLDGSRPVILVSHGNLPGEGMADFAHAAVRALADEDVTVVITTGGSPAGDPGTLPANVLVAETLSSAKLLTKTDLLITDGDYTILHSAMREGVPVIVVGRDHNNREAASRVAWSRVGINLKAGKPTARAFRRAVGQVLNDPTFAWQSKEIGKSIQISPGVGGFMEVLRQLIHAPNRSIGPTK